MIANEVNPPLTPALLVHYGVKGMKWGERKAQPTTREIQDARIRIGAREDRLARATQDLNLATNGGSKRLQDTAARAYKKAKTDYDTSEDHVTASHMTKGEKIATAILTGPLALAIIPLGKVHTKQVAKEVDDNRTKSRA